MRSIVPVFTPNVWRLGGVETVETFAETVKTTVLSATLWRWNVGRPPFARLLPELSPTVPLPGPGRPFPFVESWWAINPRQEEMAFVPLRWATLQRKRWAKTVKARSTRTAS